MNFSDIAKDLSTKSQISRALGGVVKAGKYAPWAEEYKSLAQEHYKSVEQEKKADNPILSKALLGAGLGAGAGALGKYFFGDEDTGLGDLLGAGALGALGGAGLGAGQAIYSDSNALAKLRDAFTGAAPPAGGYPLPATEAIRKEINSTGLRNVSGDDIAGYAGLGGLSWLGGTEKGLNTAQKIYQRLKPTAPVPINSSKIPQLDHYGGPSKIDMVGGKPLATGPRVKITPRKVAPDIKPGSLWGDIFKAKGLKGLASRGAAKSLRFGTPAYILYDMFNNEKSPTEIEDIMYPNLSKLTSSPEVMKNPALLKELEGMKKEVFWGADKKRVNQMLDTLNQRFSE